MKTKQPILIGYPYPTKKQILTKPFPIYEKLLIKALIHWKKNSWKIYKNSDKQSSLTALINTLSYYYNNPCFIIFNNKLKSPCYKPNKKTIYMNSSLSVISTLHEYAHHQFGPSELKACRWSVHLFKTIFPTEYKKLIWKGHLLVKNNK